MKGFISIVAGVLALAIGPAEGQPAPAGAPSSAKQLGYFNAPARTVIYNTFNENTSKLYVARAYSIVAGPDAAEPYNAAAMPFTPASDARIKRIVMAMGLFSGTPLVKISLMSDDNGAPGEIIGTFNQTDFHDGATCCETESVPGKKYPVKAGTTYWIAATAMGNTYVGWHLSDIRKRGLISYNDGTGWASRVGVPAGFAVLGE